MLDKFLPNSIQEFWVVVGLVLFGVATAALAYAKNQAKNGGGPSSLHKVIDSLERNAAIIEKQVTAAEKQNSYFAKNLEYFHQLDQAASRMLDQNVQIVSELRELNSNMQNLRVEIAKGDPRWR